MIVTIHFTAFFTLDVSVIGFYGMNSRHFD